VLAAAAISGTAPAPAAIGSCHAHAGLPDHHCTPGTADPHVSQANMRRTICRSGYTKTVRPPTSYTQPLKLRQMRAYGYYAGRRPSAYEEDHLIPLELGGAPRDPRNLWPEAHSPRPGSFQKDAVEDRLRRRVCAGAITLRAAQRAIARNWKTV
jgi:hypothetical protein